MRSREAFRNHDSLEAVTKQKQGALLLMFFFGSRQVVCDLNVVTLRSLIAHKINLKPDNFSASKSITWMEVSKDKKSEAGVIVAELPRKQSKYFQYTYTKPADYTESNTRINDTLSADSVNKVVFQGAITVYQQRL